MSNRPRDGLDRRVFIIAALALVGASIRFNDE
jgi:hypothetical protein